MNTDIGFTPDQLAPRETSMDEPRPEVRAVLNQLIDEMNPREKYPFMSKLDYVRMMRERISKEVGSEQARGILTRQLA